MIHIVSLKSCHYTNEIDHCNSRLQIGKLVGSVKTAKVTELVSDTGWILLDLLELCHVERGAWGRDECSSGRELLS